MPIVILLGIGVLLRQKKVISKAFEVEANNVVYKWALPLYLFNATLGASIRSGFSLGMTLYGVLAPAALYLILVLVLPRFYRDNRKRIGAFISVSFNSGCAIPGLMLCAALIPAGEQVPFMLALPFWMIGNMVLSAIAMSIYSQEKKSAGDTAKFLVRQIIRTPMIWAIVIGLIMNVLSIKLPEFVNSVIGYMSNLTIPLALITLGAQLDMSALKGDFKQTFMCGVVLKLVLLPLIGMLVAVTPLFHFTNTELTGAFIQMATPIGPGIYSMAIALNSDSEFLGRGMVVSQVFSCLTMFIGIVVLTAFGIC